MASRSELLQKKGSRTSQRQRKGRRGKREERAAARRLWGDVQILVQHECLGPETARLTAATLRSKLAVPRQQMSHLDLLSFESEPRPGSPGHCLCRERLPPKFIQITHHWTQTSPHPAF